MIAIDEKYGLSRRGDQSYWRITVLFGRDISVRVVFYRSSEFWHNIVAIIYRRAIIKLVRP